MRCRPPVTLLRTVNPTEQRPCALKHLSEMDPKKNQNGKLGMVAAWPGQADLCRFQAWLAYRASFRTARVHREMPPQKNKKQLGGGGARL